MLRILLSFALAASAFGADWSKLKPEGYVSDYAKVIDAGSRASIENYLAGLERASGAQIAIVTLDTLDGEPVSDVANKLFRQFGVGQKGKNEGALFLLAVRDRKSRLEVGYGLEPIVPDGVAGDILRAMRPALRASQYGPALIEAARVLGTKISASKKVELSETLPPRALFEDGPRKASSKDQRQIVQILVVVGLIGLFALMSRRGGGGRRFGGGPWIFPGGGGGFGGASSGGSSWGGFGGGDSGGGGASSDW